MKCQNQRSDPSLTLYSDSSFSLFKRSLSSIFIMDADFADLCENINDFSKDGIFASDTILRINSLPPT